jgi:DNA recombination protein RmuC
MDIMMNLYLILACLGISFLTLVLQIISFSRNSHHQENLDRLERRIRDDMSDNREEMSRSSKELREELSFSSRELRESVGSFLKDLSQLQSGSLDKVSQEVNRLNQTLEQRFIKLQADNALRLEEMRKTVDEKLQGTLEKRLSESFKLVTDRLEKVHQGLGEMQNLANGVGDLKKVLSNIKTRGIWGEVQLGNLLEQVLSPDQYLTNVVCRESSLDRVEYVIKLPGSGDKDGEVWLPIDAKFPREDYERLLEAVDKSDVEAVEVASKALETRLKLFAKEVSSKYLNPPRTTDFAIIFLPTEGLYAELLRRPGLTEQLQRDYRINLCGPTTLGALLNSLQMGFKTLAIQKRSSEVWEILRAVKTEFERYGDVMDKVQKKLIEASKTIDDVSTRKRAIDRKLRTIDSLPILEAQSLLELSNFEDNDSDSLGMSKIETDD